MDRASFLKSLIETNDFGRGFLVFGWFSQVSNLLGLLLMFCLGLKILHIGLCGRALLQLLCAIRGKSSRTKSGFGEEIDAKTVSSCKWVLDFDGEERRCDEEEGECDSAALRRLVKVERQRASVACVELEKERTAAASAADEAMAMILRLQNEKSAAEMEASHYRRLAEKKQEFDREMIQALQWIVMRHETERVVLEEKLVAFRQKLGDEDEDEEEDDVVSSVDMDMESSVL